MSQFATFPMKFFLFLSSTGGTPTTTERPFAVSRGVISTRGKEEDFLRMIKVSAEQASHGDQESDQFSTQQVVHGDQESPGGGAGYIGGEEKVCKVGDCVWTAQVLRGSLLI